MDPYCSSTRVQQDDTGYFPYVGAKHRAPASHRGDTEHQHLNGQKDPPTMIGSHCNQETTREFGGLARDGKEM